MWKSQRRTTIRPAGVTQFPWLGRAGMAPRKLTPAVRREGGATLVIVALCLFAIFGMAILVVDVGGLLLERRAMGNAADAAALAAAQSCARQEGLAEANRQATQYAIANSSGAAVSSGFPRYEPNCEADAGTVTVQVEVDHPLFFAPALGLGDSGPVVA